jgi:uncharacterized membrane protein
MRAIAVAVVVFALVFSGLDAIWLTITAERLYRPALGHLMRPDFDLVAAVAFYAVYIAGVSIFVVLPSRCARSAFGRGAIFGLVAYATYDLTNQATMRDWPWHVTFADLAWGACVTSISAWAAYLVGSRWR